MTHNQQSLFDAVPVAPAQPVTSAPTPVPADEVPMDAYADYAAYEEQPALEVPADYVPAPSPSLPTSRLPLRHGPRSTWTASTLPSARPSSVPMARCWSWRAPAPARPAC